MVDPTRGSEGGPTGDPRGVDPMMSGHPFAHYRACDQREICFKRKTIFGFDWVWDPRIDPITDLVRPSGRIWWGNLDCEV